MLQYIEVGATFFVLELQVLGMLMDAMSASPKWTRDRCIAFIVYIILKVWAVDVDVVVQITFRYIRMYRTLVYKKNIIYWQLAKNDWLINVRVTIHKASLTLRVVENFENKIVNFIRNGQQGRVQNNANIFNFNRKLTMTQLLTH